MLTDERIAEIQQAVKEQDASSESLAKLQEALGVLKDRSIRELAMVEAIMRMSEQIEYLSIRLGVDWPGLDDLLLEEASELYVKYAGLEDVPEYKPRILSSRERKERLIQWRKENKK